MKLAFCLCILLYFAGRILGQEKNPEDERLGKMSPEEFLEHINTMGTDRDTDSVEELGMKTLKKGSTARPRSR